MRDKNYINLILAHLGIGTLIFLFPFFAKVYAGAIVVTGLYFVITNKNKNNEALYAAAYILGSEVFLRATSGNPFHEYGKYFVLLFVILGILYDSIPKKNNPYWIYLLLLIPGIITAMINLKLAMRPNILFNISGPICLGICSLYTYKRKISFNDINTILLCIGAPIISFTAYLFFKCPMNNFIIGSTESNYVLSGGYAPNQTATILGLGMFVFTSRLFLVRSSRTIMIINTLLLLYIYYRTLLTFSRGGTITGLALILILIFALLIYYNQYRRLQIKIVGFLFVLIGVFWLTSYQTDGLLLMRYRDQNPNGLQKAPKNNGRQAIAMNEIQLFEKNPMLGVGVGEAKVIRESKFGKLINSHSELTRMLAEHGILGIISIFILFMTPLLLFLKNKQNLYKDKQNIYLICFFVFWLLTINHSAMRVAAPSFIYALVLLSIKKDDEVSSV
ncbi:O-antigen ligase family protein [Flavobacterium wongokense]|uniref:O-antigen ligase family protein n=1 Tax=Flavobacterium wongokense TaxID=2910674 RepID=UPI001F3C71EA|nr:O-antigen ligase family protein [Flavobacterium sp. WG47]MCF6131132.1 O-antigen ligase family protein [Flavobacterium sp. WG47]